ncbi:hypothetical protein MHBO_004346, partial [Bonamia ostreae]
FGMCVLELCTNHYPYEECINPAQIYKKVVNGNKPKILSKILDLKTKNFIDQCLASESHRLSSIELSKHPFLKFEASSDMFAVKMAKNKSIEIENNKDIDIKNYEYKENQNETKNTHLKFYDENIKQNEVSNNPETQYSQTKSKNNDENNEFIYNSKNNSIEIKNAKKHLNEENNSLKTFLPKSKDKKIKLQHNNIFKSEINNDYKNNIANSEISLKKISKNIIKVYLQLNYK